MLVTYQEHLAIAIAVENLDGFTVHAQRTMDFTTGTSEKDSMVMQMQTYIVSSFRDKVQCPSTNW